MFEKLADFIMKHSKAIIVLWILVLICALPQGIKSGEVMEYDLTAMVGNDSESGSGQKIMDDYYVNSINMSEIVVVEYDTADATLNKENAYILINNLSGKLTEKYDSKLSATVVGTYSKEGHTTGVLLAAITSPEEGYDILNKTGEIRSVLSDSKAELGFDYSTYVTGNDALTYDTMASSAADVAKVDSISILLILLLLGLFFYALCTAAVPPVGVGVAYGISLLAIYLLGHMMGIYYLTQTLVLVTMLGAGCDYAIFIVTRYREELKKGADHDSALRTSIEWAGESVFTSGLAVIIGFGALAICNFTMVRTMGIVLACGIVLTLVVALTLIPSVLNLIGGKIFWPTKVETYQAIEKGEAKGFYAKLCYISRGYFDFVARFTRKYAVPIVVVALVICVPTFYVYATTSNSFDMISIEPESESKDGLNAMMKETYGGTLMPTYVVMELNEPAIAVMGATPTGVPYVVWTDAALNISGAAPTGYIPSLMAMSNGITEKHGDIVAASSSLTSWYCLFMNGMKQAAIAYWAAHDVPNPTPEQIQSIIPTLMTDDATVDGVNKAIYSKLGSLSSSVQEGVGAILTVCSGGTTWTALPTDNFSGLKVMNLIDGVLNVSTGLINVDKADSAVLAGSSTYVGATSTTTTGKYASMMIITTEKPMSDNTMSLIGDLRDDFHGTDGYDKQMSSVYKESYITGKSASMDDISETVTAEFKVIEAVVVILLVILLFLILKCYLTPIRAVVNILMSVIWTIALTHVVFGQLMSVPVCWIVPIVLFVVLLGLGMDYDIFITTRVRENKVRGLSNDDAIDAAICSASGVISLCALIMGGTFLTLLVGSSSMLQEFGFALGIGILIDGLFMVTFVGPALMHLMGEWSWKGPAFLARKHLGESSEESSEQA